jgi:hypothetical protein
MKSAASTIEAVPREEVERRRAEYRRLAYERRSPAVIVYPPLHQPCPWPDCCTKIAGIDFQLNQMGDAARREAWLAAWWQGTGLVARCPGCGKHVLFGYEEKHTVEEASIGANALLPDDWFEKAHIAPRLQR